MKQLKKGDKIEVFGISDHYTNPGLLRKNSNGIQGPPIKEHAMLKTIKRVLGDLEFPFTATFHAKTQDFYGTMMLPNGKTIGIMYFDTDLDTPNE